MAATIAKFKIHFLLKKNIYFSKVLKFSTAHAIQEQLPHFRTLEEDPTQHTHNHVGKFYKIDSATKAQLYHSGGVPKQLNELMKIFRENCVMVREPFLEITSYLKQIDYSQPAVRFVIYGKYGTGKSSCIMHLVHYGYVSKFLLLHVPWVSEWTKRPKEIVASQFKEGMIDIPIESALWLQHFKLQNEKLMKELDLRTTQSYTWSQREVTEKGEPLMAVVEHGIQRGRHSSDCIAVLLKEIKFHSQSNRFKTMVLIDGVNTFFCKTNVKRPDKTLVPAKEITICKAFLKIVKNDWNNAVIITSVDIVPFNRNYSMQDPVTPLALLGQEGFELLDPFVPIEMINYSDKELESTVDYYDDRLWIQSEKAKSERGRKHLKFLSGYNPGALRDICGPL